MDKTTNEIIWDIMNAGGVVTAELFSLGYNYSYDSAYKKLEELYAERILCKRQYFVKPANKIVYQITQKGAKVFGKKDSNLRKKHNDFAMRRYLIKSDIYFTLLSRGCNIAVADFESEKVRALLKAGFLEENLPKRIYKAKDGQKSEAIYFDDMILSMKDNKVKTIAIDHSRLTEEVVIENIVRAYRDLSRGSDFTFYVDFVTDSKLRAAIIKNIFELKYQDALKKVKISFKYLQRSYEKSD